jgi:hypothetical protein
VTRRERAILASFILLPLKAHEKGRRAAEIVRTSPFAFASTSPFTNDRLKLAQSVSICCRRLVKKGLMQEVGRVEHKFELDLRSHPRGKVTRVYGAPQYFPSEAGFCLALSWNWHRMPDLRAKPRKKKSAQARNPYEAESSYAAARAFLRSIE